jgi:hypothetical protein
MAMKLWVTLYGMIWLVFLELWLGYTPIAPPVPLYLHIVLGVAIVVLAYRNASALRASRTVGRIKRTANATFSLSVLMALLGVAIYFHLGSTVVVVSGITIDSGIRFLHFVNAMAIFSQVSATAVVYDVWEEKEFERPSEPGVVPVAPKPNR